MNYVSTENNIIVMVKGEPFIIGRDNEKFDELKLAIKDNKPDYIIRQIVDPCIEVDQALKMLSGD